MRALALVGLVLCSSATVPATLPSPQSLATHRGLHPSDTASAAHFVLLTASTPVVTGSAVRLAPDDEGWSVVGGAANQIVNDIVIDAADNVYIAGTFSSVGGVSTAPLYMVARWNGTEWQSLGGANDWIFALAVDPSGTVYAAGRFTQIGGVAASRIARWDGSSWSAMGAGFNNPPEDLVIDSEGTVYVGGGMSVIGGDGGRGIFAWNGTDWIVPGGGTGVNNYVYTLALDPEDNLYVGGSFTQISGVAVHNVARWDGTNWLDVGGGTQSPGATVYALEVGPAGHLFAGGVFTEMGGTPTNSLSRWNGQSWEEVAGGVGGSTGGGAAVRAITFDGAGLLYIGGSFAEAGGVTVNSVARLEGSTWVPLGGGVANGTVLTLAVAHHQPYLYAGGGFSGIGGVNGLNYFARYEGGVTAPLETPSSSGPLTLFPAYPNPFATSVHLQFTSGRSERVRLEVFDVLGRRVALLFDAVVPDGHVVERVLRSDGLAAGAYAVRVSTDGHQVTRWIVLNR